MKDEAVTTDIAVRTATPMDLITKALAMDTSIEKMEQLFNLQLRWEENEAKKAYHQAVADFKAEAVDIVKNKQVKFKTEKGVTEYKHAELGQIVNTVTPLLSKFGLSHHWEYSQSEGKIKVTCFLTHNMGYGNSTSLTNITSPSDINEKLNILPQGWTPASCLLLTVLRHPIPRLVSALFYCAHGHNFDGKP